MANSSVKIAISPSEFFREQVASAINRQKLSVSEEIEYYLVNLLIDFIDPRKHQPMIGEKDILGMPIALVLKAAIEAPDEDKLKLYKVLGDFSLYFSGYFQDFFNNKSYDVDYYITLGTTAYQQAAMIVRESLRAQHQAQTFKNLANDFECLVDVLAEIKDQLHPSGSTDLLATYERWIRTNSHRLRKKLEDSGIIPVSINIKNVN